MRLKPSDIKVGSSYLVALRHGRNVKSSISKVERIEGDTAFVKAANGREVQIKVEAFARIARKEVQQDGQAQESSQV